MAGAIRSRMILVAGFAAFTVKDASASPMSSPSCALRFERSTAILLPPARNSVKRAWGGANVSPIAGGGVRVLFPLSSINPGHPTAPVGGAGWLEAVGEPAAQRCLVYKVRFENGFAFNKGGKLPGLYGGDAPSGCSPAALSKGFSARLMWREGGVGELYLYSPDRQARCGQSLGRGRWRFVPGQDHEVAQEVILNKPDAADGIIRLWLDGKLVLEQRNLLLRSSSDVLIDGMMFSTFFGGSDPTWASPRNQYAQFTQAMIWDRSDRRR